MGKRPVGEAHKRTEGSQTASKLPFDQPIRLAKIGAAHGIRGEVRVKPLTEDPEAIGDYGPLSSRDGETILTVVSLRPVKGNMLVVKFKELTDRNQAEALNGMDLFVDRSAFGETDDEDDFFVTDLVGLMAVHVNGSEIGKVVSVQDFGAGDLLEVSVAPGKTAFIPFTKMVVPEVNLASGEIRIDPPIGLLSDATSSAATGQEKASNLGDDD